MRKVNFLAVVFGIFAIASIFIGAGNVYSGDNGIVQSQP